jgi:hypothetical protein
MGGASLPMHKIFTISCGNVMLPVFVSHHGRDRSDLRLLRLRIITLTQRTPMYMFSTDVMCLAREADAPSFNIIVHDVPEYGCPPFATLICTEAWQYVPP